MSPEGPSPDASTPPGPEAVAQSRLGRVAVTGVIVALMVMWAWIWFFAPRENVDRFSQRAFPEAANPVCAAAHDEILALPSGRQTPNVTERAAVVRQGTEIVETMVADLEAIAYLVTDPTMQTSCVNGSATGTSYTSQTAGLTWSDSRPPRLTPPTKRLRFWCKTSSTAAGSTGLPTSTT